MSLAEAREFIGNSSFRSLLDIDQAVLDSIPAGIYVCDPAGVVRRHNRAAEQLWGRAPRPGDTDQKFCGALRLFRMDGSLLPHDETPMEHVLRTGLPRVNEKVVIERPDGSCITVLVHISPLLGTGNRLEGAINCFQDISELQAAKNTIAGNELRYRSIFESARVALWDQDFSPLMDLLNTLRDRGIDDIRTYFEERPAELLAATALVSVRDVNDYALELFEAPHKSALLGALGATFLPETHSVFLDEIVALWNGETRFEGQAKVRTLTGRVLTVVLTIAWNGVRNERSLVSLLDISRQKATERRLEILNEIAKVLAGEFDLDRAVQLVTDRATELSGAKFGAFFYNVTDSAGETYLLYALSGAPRAAFEKFGLPRNTKVFAPTFRGEGVIRSDDIRLDPRYGKNAPHHGMPAGHLPVVSYLAVPVISRSGTVHGGLFFGHDQSGAFSKDCEDLVSGIAAHAAIAIDNAHLLGAERREAAQRKRADEALTRLAAIVEASDYAIVSKSLDATVTSWNAAAERLFGYSEAEIVGKPITVLVPDDCLDEARRISTRVNGGESIEDHHTVRVTKSGTRIDVSLTTSPLRDADGRVTGASALVKDITERKRIERRQNALHILTESLHLARSRNEVYEAGLDAILSALQCERASILLFDAEGSMRFVAARGLSAGYQRAVDGHSPWTPETADARPVAISDINLSTESESLKSTIRDEGIRSLLFIPLIIENKVIGKFMGYCAHPRHFTSDEIDIAVTIARQLVVSIERLQSEEGRAKAEADARARSAELEAIMESVPAIIWITRSPDGRVIEGNRASQEFLGLPKESNASLSAPDDERPDHFEVLIGGRKVLPEDLPVQQAARGRLIRNCEEEIRFSDGRVRYILGNAAPLRDQSGTVRGAVAAFVDVSERREAEVRLHASEQRLQLALSAGRMGAWEWNIKSGSVVWSPGLEAIHGLEAGAFEGTFDAFKRDIYADDIEGVIERITKAVTGSPDYHLVYRIKRPDGAVRWIESFGQRVDSPLGEPLKLVGVCTDITERKSAEEQRDLLVAELSHRVKNTLATVISIQQQSFIRARSVDEARGSFKARIQALAQTHTRLAEHNWTGVPLNVLLQDELRPYRRDDGRNLEVSGEHLTLNPKGTLSLGLVFHELATNAAKYGALSVQSGSVSVDWSIEPDADRIRIRWSERGGPSVKPPSRSGFGRLLLERGVHADLKGKVDLQFRPTGLVCDISIPLHRLLATSSEASQ